MKKSNSKRIAAWVIVCAAVFTAALCNFTGYRTDVVLTGFTVQEDDSLILKVAVSGSAGYVKSMRVKESGEDVYVDFRSTFGINNPRGAKSEFRLEVSPECKNILFRGGRHSYRIVLRKAGNEWKVVMEEMSME